MNTSFRIQKKLLLKKTDLVCYAYIKFLSNYESLFLSCLCGSLSLSLSLSVSLSLTHAFSLSLSLSFLFILLCLRPYSPSLSSLPHFFSFLVHFSSFCLCQFQHTSDSFSLTVSLFLYSLTHF